MTPEIGWALGTFSAIFVVVDPIAVVPIFLAITPNDSEVERRSMALREIVEWRRRPVRSIMTRSTRKDTLCRLPRGS